MVSVMGQNRPAACSPILAGWEMSLSRTGKLGGKLSTVSQSVSQSVSQANYRIEMFIEGRADRGITDIYK